MNTRFEKFRNLKYVTIVMRDETTVGTTCYIASHPELPGCISQGDTPEEAIRNLEEARELVIDHLLNNNLPVPIPQHLLSKESIFQPGDYNALLAPPQPMRGIIAEKLIIQTGNFDTEARNEYKVPVTEFGPA